MMRVRFASGTDDVPSFGSTRSSCSPCSESQVPICDAPPQTPTPIGQKPHCMPTAIVFFNAGRSVWTARDVFNRVGELSRSSFSSFWHRWMPGSLSTRHLASKRVGLHHLWQRLRYTWPRHYQKLWFHRIALKLRNVIDTGRCRYW